MDQGFLQWAATLGVGGVLAAGMFMVYRHDIKRHTETWKAAAEQLIQVMKENSAQQAKLLAILENLERRGMPRRKRPDVEED